MRTWQPWALSSVASKQAAGQRCAAQHFLLPPGPTVAIPVTDCLRYMLLRASKCGILRAVESRQRPLAMLEDLEKLERHPTCQMILCYTISFIEACEGWCVKSVGPDIPLQLLSWVPGHFVFPYYRLRGSDERSHQLAATESRDMTSTRPGKMQKELDTVVLPSLPAASSSRLSLFCCFRMSWVSN